MNAFQRLPGYTRAAAGLEWRLWKRLPAILAWGTAGPLTLVLWLWWRMPANAATLGDAREMLSIYQLLGLVVLHWTLVLTTAIGCLIVLVMKGPAYVADAYPPPGRGASAALGETPGAREAA